MLIVVVVLLIYAGYNIYKHQKLLKKIIKNGRGKY